VPPSLG